MIYSGMESRVEHVIILKYGAKRFLENYFRCEELLVMGRHRHRLQSVKISGKRLSK